MNDKDMEAAREAAGQLCEQKHFMQAIHRDFFRRGYEDGYNAGYNAAQPKPCVWKWQLGIMGYPGCQDGSGPPSPANGPFCPYCGGKIEEANSD